MTVMIDILPRPGTPHRAVLALGSRRVPCALGRAGITRHKREGDGATPAGTLRLVGLLARPDRRAGRRIAVEKRAIRPADAWCEALSDPAYNCLVRLPHRATSDPLTRADHLYDLVGVLDWNLGPMARRGRGSAIFLHHARPGLGPTAGCIALHPRDLAALLSAFGPRLAFRVGQKPVKRRR